MVYTEHSDCHEGQISERGIDMTDISILMTSGRKPLCARCRRPFTPKKEGDKYGPRCAAKLAGQIQLDSMALISGKVLKA
jgi:predicted amidophosphoribosyltransferase